jgi:hypothetical protein
MSGMEVTLRDGSVVKAALPEGLVVSVATPYGQLDVPVGDVTKLSLAQRLSADETAAVEKALAQLTCDDKALRSEAAKTLRRVGAAALPLIDKAAAAASAADGVSRFSGVSCKAEPAVAQMLQGADEPTAAAATAIDEISRLQRVMRLERVVTEDTVETKTSKFVGRILTESLPVRNPSLGASIVALTAVKSIKVTHVATGLENETVLPDPGSVNASLCPIGKPVLFRVTGGVGGACWGSGGTYTMDSNLATCCVHSGALALGETGIVKVTAIGSQPSYSATQANGVQSSCWGAWDGFTVEPF